MMTDLDKKVDCFRDALERSIAIWAVLGIEGHTQDDNSALRRAIAALESAVAERERERAALVYEALDGVVSHDELKAAIRAMGEKP